MKVFVTMGAHLRETAMQSAFTKHYYRFEKIEE